ncbi:hypothetical protein GF318_03835 [Candidatus Micrarchaeota archaeon]|nr:hypothetical protein [Candidatus Micrarchaeota archaeon]
MHFGGDFMILLFTPNNTASLNIAEKLIERHGFEKTGEKEWERGGNRLIETGAPTILDVPTGFDTDLILVLSTHRSRGGKKMLTAHFPGNWDEAKFGGEPRTLNTAYASRLKTMIRELENANTLDWPVYIEADHHGPTCKAPIMFVEIGSTGEEWKNQEAGRIVAQAVSEFLKKNETYEAVLGVGGGHYSREFTKLVLESSLAVGHIAPKYAIEGIAEDTFRQAVQKTVEPVKKVLILKKETNSSQKKKIAGLAERFGLETGLV